MLKNADGSIYEGSWLNDKMNGIGKFKQSDGTEYEGEFKDN